MTNPGIRYGTHRVLEPVGVLPQAARVLNAELPIDESEILIDVEVLNIDAASFAQMKTVSGNDPDGIAALITKTVAERGKQHNPVTGSGGMLIGTVREVGPRYDGTLKARPGDRIATLVSLSLTPLHLDEIIKVHMDRDQVEVRGHAILFSSGIGAVLPNDMSRETALAALDVCGAPAQTYRLVKPAMKVGILGAGKSGLLVAAVAKELAGIDGRVIALDYSRDSLNRFKELGVVDDIIEIDARQAVDVFSRVHEATNGEMFDVTINTANVGGTEMAAVMATRSGGIVYYFNMATSFTAATLGTEGIGHDVTLIMGNGYVPDNDAITLDVLRRHPRVLEYFEQRYGGR